MDTLTIFLTGVPYRGNPIASVQLGNAAPVQVAVAAPIGGPAQAATFTGTWGVMPSILVAHTFADNASSSALSRSLRVESYTYNGVSTTVGQTLARGDVFGTPGAVDAAAAVREAIANLADTLVQQTAVGDGEGGGGGTVAIPGPPGPPGPVTPLTPEAIAAALTYAPVNPAALAPLATATPATGNTVTTLPSDALVPSPQPDGTVRFISLTNLRAQLLSSTAPTVTITGLAFTTAGTVAANSAVGTVLGTLSSTATGGSPVNTAYSLVVNGENKFKLAGTQVQLALGTVAAGTYVLRARVTADNALAFEQDFQVTVAVEASPPVVTGITFTPAARIVANSAVDTLAGTLSAQATGGALVNPAFTLLNTASGAFKLVGAQVRFAASSVAVGSYTIRPQVTSSNAAAYAQDLTVTVTSASEIIVGTGEGPDFDFGYGHADTLAVPFNYKAVDAMPAGEVVQFAQPTAAKDLPAGWRWYAETADGARVAVQQDMEGTFADGSLETSALTITNPTLRTAGTVIPLTLKAENVAPDRTPVISHTAVRAALAGLKMEATGYDLGADTLVLPAAWVLDNCPEWNATTGWGMNPVGGWQYLKRGPQCVELLIWGYYRNASLSASHKWLRVNLLCQRLVNGMWDIGVVHSQPNAFNAHPAGTLGAARQARIACEARLKDGATTLYTWGAPGDPNTITRPLSAIDRATGRIDFAGGLADDNGGDGVVLGITGSDLPAGIVSGQTLGHVNWDGTGNVLTVQRHSFDFGRVTFGSGGSGDISFHPLAVTWPNGFAALYTSDGSRVRWGGGARPLALPMHDRGYLTRRAKVVPAMNLSLPNVPLANQGKPKFIMGSTYWLTWGLEAPSNGPGDDRIGYVTSTGASLLWAPDDEARHRRAIVNSLQFLHFHIAYWDETSGTEVVANTGPGFNGATTYPGMGAVTSGWTTYVGDQNINIGNSNEPNPGPRIPGHFSYAKWKQTPSLPTASGYHPQYDSQLEGQHCPQHHLVPWLRTADYVHLIGMRGVAATVHSGAAFNVIDINGKQTRPYDHGGRGFAWTLAPLSCAASALPDSDPCRQMFSDMIEGDGLYWSVWRPANYPGMEMGQVFAPGAASYIAYAHIVACQELLKGKHPVWRTAIEIGARWSVGNYDDTGEIGNGAYNFGTFGNGPSDRRDPVTYTSLTEYNKEAFGLPPYPANGFRDGFPNLTYTARAEMCALRLMRSCYEMGLTGGMTADAGRVEGQVLARQAAAGMVLESGYNSTTGQLFPQWDMVSVLPPAASAAPGAVTGAVESDVSATTATVSWVKPATGGPAISYRLRVKKGAGAYAVIQENYGYTSIGLQDLQDGAVNVLEITARNSVGLGAPVEVSFTTPAYVTAVPTTRQRKHVDISANSTITFDSPVGATGRKLVFAAGYDTADVDPGTGWASLGVYHDGDNLLCSGWTAPLSASPASGVDLGSVEAILSVVLVETSGASVQSDVLSYGAFSSIPMLPKNRAEQCLRYVWVHCYANGTVTGFSVSGGTVLEYSEFIGPNRRVALIELPDGQTGDVAISAVGGGVIGDARIVRVNVYSN